MSEGPARILLVDDELALLSLMDQFLSRMGYQVEAFCSAQEALERFETAPGAYSLVVADILMPDMPGGELLLRLLGRNPQLRVLVCTGAPFSILTLPPESQPQIGFLQKPFTPQMLAEAVKRLLEAGGEQAAGTAQGR